MSVYIWAAARNDYSAMRGPCPEGFHVPTYDDWDAMPNGSENLFQLYHLPPGFEFSSTSLRIVEHTSTSDYRICNRVSVQTSQSTAQVLHIYSGWWANHYPCPIVQANHIRPFKDIPAYPDNTWTKVYEEEDECEVYHNATLWLITVHYYSTDDCWIRKTMADKNLWATVLYNYWDTQSTANCGYIYQHWNNYWFDPQWTISTSSAVVDCTWYWPWNYYSNNLMRTSNWNQTNKNMWWWETWVNEDIAELKSAYIGEYVDYLCFTANSAWSIVKIHKVKAPADVTLEFSTDKSTRSTYTFSNTISLTNAWDKVYFRNTSETDVQFSIDEDNYYRFEISGSVSWSWDVTTLLNKNWTLTLSNYCFYNLFNSSALTTPPDIPVTTVGNYSCENMFRACSNLTTVPKLPALNIWTQGYGYMFYDCTSLAAINELPATTLTYYCYGQMYRWCTQIKLSSTQTWEYQTPYRIPSSWTWSWWTQQTNFMFLSTWGTFADTPEINTTYYTSNTVI